MKTELLRKMFNHFRETREERVQIYRGRVMAHDTAYQFRMGAGFVGDVNRTHPSAIEPCLIDPANPPLLFGSAVMVDRTATNGVRAPVVGDNAAAGSIFGVAVRPFPFQQASGGPAAAYGGEVPPATGVIDVMKSGYIMVKLNGATAAVKGGSVFVWADVTGGGHINGGFEAAATGGSTIGLDASGNRIYFNGPADANGIVELVFNP